MKSDTKKKLVLIMPVQEDKYYETLKNLGFEQDKRIQFVGTVYNRELLKYIRENAYAYLHGHEVGGTNPSLLEAMAATPLNLLLNVGFNKAVGQDAALYWSKTPGSLMKTLNLADTMPEEKYHAFHPKALEIIETAFTWDIIIDKYEKLFLEG
jgi:rhamnosyltransferase